jgi:DNA-binding PadR family transcriptional regulator
MSRGIGKVQREVLDIMSHGGPWQVHHLASEIYQDGSKPTRAQLGAIRRALIRLQRERLIRARPFPFTLRPRIEWVVTKRGKRDEGRKATRFRF